MNNRSKWVFFLFVLAAVIVIGVIDYYTDPMLDLEILYFIPITLAAWSLGRRWAAVIVVAALVPVYAELRVLAAAGQISEIVVAVDMVVRVLVYAFVAELVYRLVMSRQEV